MTRSLLVVKKRLKVHEKGLFLNLFILVSHTHKVSLWLSFFLFSDLNCSSFIAFILKCYKRGKTIHNLIVKAEEIFRETRTESFLNIAVLAFGMLL